MIRFGRGNLLTQDVDALVNPVNCVGVLGKGLALQFKRAFPEMVEPYQRACADGEVMPGVVHVVDRGATHRPRWILNVPTKRHWRNPSRLDDVAAGVRALADKIRELAIRSIAVPPLGCGNGGLDWSDVRTLLLAEFGNIDAEVILFAPAGSPVPEDMPNRSAAPELTPERAELLLLLSAFLRGAAPFRVAERTDTLARLEIQKLVYLAQVFAGTAEHQFERGRYGPYSHGLERELKEWEGHFVLGYGDATDKVLELRPISLVADAVARAMEAAPAGYGKVVDAVLHVVNGWESTYELELLATTLFTFREGTATSARQAYEVIASWSRIPSHLFTARHVAIAWDHLRSTGWLSEPAPVA